MLSELTLRTATIRLCKYCRLTYIESWWLGKGELEPTLVLFLHVLRGTFKHLLYLHSHYVKQLYIIQIGGVKTTHIRVMGTYPNLLLTGDVENGRVSLNNLYAVNLA